MSGSPHTITANYLGDTAFGTSNKTANPTVTKAPLTVTADAKTKVYGQGDPALTYVATGYQFTDNGTTVLTGGLSRRCGRGRGQLRDQPGQLASSGNYTISYVGGEPGGHEGPADGDGRREDEGLRAERPGLTYVATGYQFTDNGTTVLTGSLSRVAGEDVGSYAISQGSLAASGNYTISYVGANLAVTKAPLTVTADAKTKVYGQSDPALTYVATGYQFTDNGTTVLTGSLSRVAGENVGSYAISQGGLAAPMPTTRSATWGRTWRLRRPR